MSPVSTCHIPDGRDPRIEGLKITLSQVLCLLGRQTVDYVKNKTSKVLKTQQKWKTFQLCLCTSFSLYPFSPLVLLKVPRAAQHWPEWMDLIGKMQ